MSQPEPLEGNAPGSGAAGPDGANDAPAGPDYEGLLLRAGFNYHVFIAAAMGHAREHGGSAEEFIAWAAERLGTSWTGLRGHGADAVLGLILENLASTGYAVRDVQAGADLSRAVVGAVPLGLEADQWQQLLAPFGVTAADMHALFRIFIPLGRSAGASVDLAGMRDTLQITVRRDVEGDRPDLDG